MIFKYSKNSFYKLIKDGKVNDDMLNQKKARQLWFWLFLLTTTVVISGCDLTYSSGEEGTTISIVQEQSTIPARRPTSQTPQNAAASGSAGSGNTASSNGNNSIVLQESGETFTILRVKSTRFTPKTISAKTGQRVSLEIHVESNRQESVTIESHTSSAPILPKEKQTIVFTAGLPGSYAMYNGDKTITGVLVVSE